jgi:hypothetical protein
MSLGLKSPAGFRLAIPRAIAYRKICLVFSWARFATSLDGKHELSHVGSRHRINKLVAERGKGVRFQTSHDGIRMARRLVLWVRNECLLLEATQWDSRLDDGSGEMTAKSTSFAPRFLQTPLRDDALALLYHFSSIRM